MIVVRYLAREILLNCIAVTAILLLLVVSGRFIKYLAQAAAGELSADVLLDIMLYRLPGFLELILPLALFLGILLGYGRLYLESEMVILKSTGMSPAKLIKYTLLPISFIMFLVLLLGLWLSPLSAKQTLNIFAEQKQRNQLETLVLGRFQQNNSDTGQRLYYTEPSTAEDAIGRTFLLEQQDQQPTRFILSQTGNRYVDDQGRNFLQLNDGYQYEGQIGQADYAVTKFERYTLKLKDKQLVTPLIKAKAKSSWDLWQSDLNTDKAELHWRFSLPILVLVVALLAIGLSQVNPRQGRYANILPAILFYFVYIGLLSAVRNKVEDGQLPIVLFYMLHLLFFAIAWLSLFGRTSLELVSSYFWQRLK